MAGTEEPSKYYDLMLRSVRSLSSVASLPGKFRHGAAALPARWLPEEVNNPALILY
jgi:hypothetical protein